MKRRAFLAGMSSLALATFARRLVADPAPPPPKRLVLVMHSNGTQQSNFWPRAEMTSPILDPLLSDARVRARTTIVKGVYVPWDSGGTDGNEHDMGFARMFTGYRLRNVSGHPWGGGPSVDQIVAKEWRERTLNLACLTSRTEPHPKPGFLHRRSFSYVAAGVLRVPIEDPFVAYQRLFAPPEERDGVTRQRLLLRKSALDPMKSELARLRDAVSREERDKLDRHLESVREIERDLLRSISGEALGCGTRPPPPPEYTTRAPRLLVDDESAIPAIVQSMVDLIAAALTCGAPRIATLQLGYGGAKWSYDWEGIGYDCHGYLAHLDSTDGASSPDVIAKLVRVHRWNASMIARLAKKLADTPEGDRSVLDRTLIVWASDMGRGDHSLENVPVVLVGGAGMPSGGKLVDVGRQPFQRVGCTALRAMGLDVGGFGDLPDCGPLQGL
jgi:hypothetical protein